MAGGIFISYRRDDSRHAAGRLVDRLRQVFPQGQLFMDVDNIDIGLDFVEVLGEKVAACDVMLVVIGPEWLRSQDSEGKRRLDNPNDFVRIEVEQALARNVRVIPVLVDGAQMPMQEELPPSMQSLIRRQATRLSHERFGSDADGLIAGLKRITEPPGKGATVAGVMNSLLSSSAQQPSQAGDAELYWEAARKRWKWSRVAIVSFTVAIVAFVSYPEFGVDGPLTTAIGAILIPVFLCAAVACLASVGGMLYWARKARTLKSKLADGARSEIGAQDRLIRRP